MTGPVCAKTDVLVHRHDGPDQIKQLRAASWLRLLVDGRPVRLSVQVLQEIHRALMNTLIAGLGLGDLREIVSAAPFTMNCNAEEGAYSRVDWK